MPLHVTLRSVGNPDYGQDETRPMPGVPNEFVEAADFAAASKACRDYIERHGLGSGNWAGGTIYDDANVEVGRVSYNGKIWAPGPWVNGSEPIWPSPEGERKRKAKEKSPFEWESATVEVEGYGTFELSGCLRRANVKATDTFRIDGVRHDFNQTAHFSEDGSVQGPTLVSFMRDGRYDQMGGNDVAESAVQAALKSWAEEPENLAMILRNEIKDNMRDVHRIDTVVLPHAKAAYEEKLAQGNKEKAEHVARAEAAQERLDALMGSAPRP